MAKRLDQLRKGEEFVRYAECRGAHVRQGRGSHVIVENENGQAVVPVGHTKELGKGLRCALVKVFVGMGLGLTLVGMIVNQLNGLHM